MNEKGYLNIYWDAENQIPFMGPTYRTEEHVKGTTECGFSKKIGGPVEINLPDGHWD